jgi:hypothetical protein
MRRSPRGASSHDAIAEKIRAVAAHVSPLVNGFAGSRCRSELTGGYATSIQLLSGEEDVGRLADCV